MKTLSIIGAGKLGRALGRMFAARGLAVIHQVLNRSLESSQKAVEFIGQGKPARDWAELTRADFILVSPPDGAIGLCAEALAGLAWVSAETVVFHCCGALSSDALAPLRARRAPLASAHPVRSFADPAAAARDFAGTFCGAEGDPQALDALRPLFEACGARWLLLKPAAKILYHAGAVMAGNYVTTLLEAAFECYELAGIPRDISAELMAPLVAESVSNCLRHGPAQALTGPIARGDDALVARQDRALFEKDARLSALYRAAGLATVQLARQQGVAPKERLDRIENILSNPDNNL